MPAFFEQGFSVRETPWHGLGEVLADYPGRDEAMRLAGHDFEVEKVPAYAVVGGKAKRLDDWRGLARVDTGDVLHMVSKQYEPIQFSTMWDVADALVNLPNVRYETGGLLKGGAIGWVLAWLDEPTTIPGDDSPTYPWVCCSTAHDGSGALRAGAFSIRVVCWNTYSAGWAGSEAAGLAFTFRHTRNVMERIEEAKDAIKGVRASHAAYVELATELAKTPVTRAAQELFMTRFIPMPAEAAVSDRVAKNVEEARNAVRTILQGATTAEAHRATGYGLFQAGVEYLDHVRGYRNETSKFGRSLLRQERAKDGLAKLIRDCVREEAMA